MAKIELENGKYTIVNELNEGGGFHALRYGEQWRNLAGDNLILAMVHRMEELQDRLSQAEDLLSEAHDMLDDVHCYDTETFEAITKYFYGEE